MKTLICKLSLFLSLCPSVPLLGNLIVTLQYNEVKTRMVTNRVKVGSARLPANHRKKEEVRPF